MKHDTLVRALLAAPAQTKRTAEVTECFSCGRPFTYCSPKGDGTSGRLCSDRCRQWFDGGNPPYEPIDYRKLFGSTWRRVAGPSPGYIPKPMKMAGRWGEAGRGWYIECAGCGKTFESRGLHCCSTECECALREREDRAKDMAAVGMEPAAKRRCEYCGKALPRWVNGKALPKTTRFCPGGKCAQKARRHAKNGRPRQSVQNYEKAGSTPSETLIL